ncbi:hypothetical protein [Streptomyces sp. UG1]|uniref:hypothetical protein n=1 Tax=Streptomyces sp. UG1 TaxID=3417652 RepID=UPI003CFB09B5
MAQAAVNQPLAGPLRTSYTALQNVLVRLITEATEGGSADEGTTPPDPRHEACTLLEVLRAHLAGLWRRLGATRPLKAV